jgi:pimeloyl-ACP methyl ester carboxylesterase
VTASGTAVLLLTSPLAPAAGRRRLHEALAAVAAVTAPTWTLAPAASDLLAAPVDQVRRALDGAPGPVVVCGVGSGSVLALRLAGEAPDRVSGLVLATGRRPAGPRLARSVHRGVADLLPLPVLQRLHASDRQLVQTLDLVRTQDVRGLAAGVPLPARVAWGRRDPLDRPAAVRLAAALPGGTLVTLDGAAPGWVWDEPGRLAALVAER